MPTLNRYLGCNVKWSAGGAPGLCASLEGEWDTQAQIWYEGNLAAAGVNYLFWGDTTGEINIWDWSLSPTPAAVEILVDDIFSGAPVSITATQGAADTEVVVIGGCYSVGSAGNVKAERMGDRLYFRGATTYKILS